MKKITALSGLTGRIKNKCVENCDLSDIKSSDIAAARFSGCTISNVVFPLKLENVTFENCLLRDVKFMSAELRQCSFKNAELHNVNFSGAALYYSSFEQSKIQKSRFRDATIIVSDFRYAAITNTTFENANVLICDFYRSVFREAMVFDDTCFVYCSLNHCYADTSCFTRKNLTSPAEFIQRLMEKSTEKMRGRDVKMGIFSIDKCGVLSVECSPDVGFKKSCFNKYRISRERKTVLLPEDEKAFEVFHANGFTDSNNKPFSDDDWKKRKNRFAEAARIYRHLTALWESKGFFRDASWAFVKAKRCENRQRGNDMKENPLLFFRWFINLLIDFFTGYGTSIGRIARSYVLLLAVFSLIYTLPNNSLLLVECLPFGLNYSFSSMIGLTKCDLSPRENSAAILLQMLSYVQSAFGILLTGFLGFVVADRIRKS